MEIIQENKYLKQFSLIIENIDIFMGFAVMCILMVMIIPIPTIFLDLLLSLNITLSLIILLVGMYILKPLELSAFPAILLLTTLFRLSLNVASTRIILLNGSDGSMAAGKVIKAFGSFVVGGNYLVGVIVFIILVVINFMVITKGAGRIAEVAARFTLDSLPGKQMSIDADLNAGMIDEKEARERREQISKESEYYGAMDGANKFVRGDAIAGIIITIINIVAGFAIGVLQNKMSFAEAAQTYTILTVGDGLVSQIPALIISTSAGIIVTRAGSSSSLGQEISSQLLGQPRAIAATSAILFIFAVIPGLPTVPFFILSLVSGFIAFFVFQFQREGLAEKESLELIEEKEQETAADNLFSPLPPLDILSLEIGYGLIPMVDVEQNGELLDKIKAIRSQIAQEVGIIVPSIHIQDNMQLKPSQYNIFLKGIEVAGGDLMVNHYLAMNSGSVMGSIDGILTKEPTFGIEAFWIKEDVREDAISKGYTVVDLPTVLTTHLSEIIRRHAHELLGRQEVQKLLDYLKETHPKVVEELIPNLMSLGSLVKVLHNLLVEQVPIRDMLTILETLADWAPLSKQTEILSEYVRQAMARRITGLYQAFDDQLNVITLDQNVEKKVAEAIQTTDQASFLAIEPIIAQRIMNDLANKIEKFAELNLQPIVLCTAQIRYHFKRLADRFIPNLVVLSYDEILSTVKIQSLGVVELPDAN